MQIKLTDLTTFDLQDFYDYQYKLGKDPRTVLHYYRNINQVLEKARKTKLILVNQIMIVKLRNQNNTFLMYILNKN